jgi:uncharacterized protein YndB with AHSA1/START domain
MTESATQETTGTATVFVHRVYIKAAPQAVWDAITDPEWNARYGYQCRGNYELRPGGTYHVLANQEMKDFGAPDIIIDGEVIEVDPPHRLVQTWHGLFSPGMEEEGHTRLTWELEEQPGGITRLTLTHDVRNAPVTYTQISGQNAEAGGGWAMILSDLKTLLETGKPFQG